MYSGVVSLSSVGLVLEELGSIVVPGLNQFLHYLTQCMTRIVQQNILTEIIQLLSETYIYDTSFALFLLYIKSICILNKICINLC